MREFHVYKALHSFRSLSEIIGELTEEEVLHVLEVESGSRRRSGMIDKLILKAAELRRHAYLDELRKKYLLNLKSLKGEKHGPFHLRRPHQG